MAVRTVNPGNAVTQTRSVTVSATDWGILVVRLALGVIFFMHGSQKVFGWFGGHPLADSAAGMAHMGIPIALAYVSILTELVGGIFVILGVLTRVAALGLFINMVVAVALVHFKNGFFLGGGPGPGYEYNVALIAMSLSLLISGPGAIALSDWEGRLFGSRKARRQD